MDDLTAPSVPGNRGEISRQGLIRLGAAATGAAFLGGRPGNARRTEGAATTARGVAGGADLRPLDPIQTIFAAMARFPLVAICERHMLQEWHDFISALLFHPDLPRSLTDIVVEFGCASYQDVADRFLLTDQPVARADLMQIWRQVGDPAWNAPVYEQFFRTVRAINWQRRPAHRIRVLLGQPPGGMDQALAHPHNRALIRTFVSSTPVDAHYAEIVEREVLAKGRRALLIAGGGHLLRGLHDEDGSESLNAASRLVQHHPDVLYVVADLLLRPGMARDPLTQRLQSALYRWPRPALAMLAGTWLGAMTRQLSDIGTLVNQLARRAVSPAAARFEAQADAVLYLGRSEDLTASQPDPSIYYWGTYPRHLRRLDSLTSQAIDQSVDQLTYGIRWATDQPSWWSLWGS